MLRGGQYAADGGSRATSDASMAAVLEFAAATMEVLEARRDANPTDDLISVWAHSDVEYPDGTVRPMTDDEIVHEALLLLDGGAETTRTVIGTMCLELTRHPDQRQQLRRRPRASWARPASRSSSAGSRRSSTCGGPRPRTTSSTGRRSAPATSCVLMYSSANRDERVFPDPDTLRRDPRAQPPRRVRVRHALLPRCVARAPRDPGDVRGAAAPDAPTGASPRAPPRRRSRRRSPAPTTPSRSSSPPPDGGLAPRAPSIPAG